MNPSSENPVSKFAFKFNLYRYMEEGDDAALRAALAALRAPAVLVLATVGRCELTPPDP